MSDVWIYEEACELVRYKFSFSNFTKVSKHCGSLRQDFFVCLWESGF